MRRQTLDASVLDLPALVVLDAARFASGRMGGTETTKCHLHGKR